MSARLPAATILLLLTACACGAQPAQPSSPAPQPLTLEQYGHEIENDSAAARRLKDHPGDAASLQKALPAEWTVIADGQSYTVSLAWLRDQLKILDSEPDRAAEISVAVVARLNAMRAGAEAMTAAIPPDPTARRRLGDLLKSPEYRGVTGPNPLRNWWEKVLGWLAEKLGFLFTGAGRHSTLSATLVWLLAAAVALFLIVWLVRPALRVSTGTPLKLEHPTSPEAGGLAGRALACADRGDYREAIRLAYCLALARLEENGIWRTDRARTPREYLRLLSRDAARRPPMASLTLRFERAWYAGVQVSENDFRNALVELGDLGCPLDWSRATAASF